MLESLTTLGTLGESLFFRAIFLFFQPDRDAAHTTQTFSQEDHRRLWLRQSSESNTTTW